MLVQTFGKSFEYMFEPYADRIASGSEEITRKRRKCDDFQCMCDDFQCSVMTFNAWSLPTLTIDMTHDHDDRVQHESQA